MGTSDKPGAEALGGGLPQQRRIDDRCHKGLQDGHRRKIGGPLLEISAYTMKHPPVQYPDFVARELLERFIKGEVCDPRPEAPLMSRVAQRSKIGRLSPIVPPLLRRPTPHPQALER